MEETEVAGRLSAVEQRSKSNSHRLDALEKQTEALNSLTTAVAVMTEKVDNCGESVAGLRADVQEIKQKPAKRWEFVVERAIYIVVAAVVGYFLARAGLG
jgi:hypothetical protein